MFCVSCGSRLPDGASFCATCGTRVPGGSPDPGSLTRAAGTLDVGSDVRAAIAARRELGPDMEDHLVEAFVTRLDERINARIDEALARRIPRVSRGRGGLHNLPEPALVVGGTMALAIPLIGAGGSFSAVPIMIGVVLINLFYFVFRSNK